MSILIAIAALALSAPATLDEKCEIVGDMAKLAMEQRQRNIRLSEFLRIANSFGEGADIDPKEKADLVALFREIGMNAYDEPLFTTEEVQQQVINEFANKWEKSCYDRGRRK